MSAFTFQFDISATLWDASANKIPIVNTGGSFTFSPITYSLAAGVYSVTIAGTYTENGSIVDGLQLCQAVNGTNYSEYAGINITQFGGIPLCRNTGKFVNQGTFVGFAGKITALDAPTILTNTSFFGAFRSSTVPSVNFGNIGSWNTVNVTNMDYMFNNATNFNQNIGNWNTSNVTTMSFMFQSATNFNQNIGNWNTSNVTNMCSMFQSATNFNKNIGSWNTANVTDMSIMFSSAINFNNGESTNLAANPMYWNTRKVDIMDQMFQNAAKFNQHIGAWDTRKLNAVYATNIFTGATAFNNAVTATTNLPGTFKTNGTIYRYSELVGYTTLTTPYSQTEFSIVDLSANKFVFDITQATWTASAKTPIINTGSFEGLSYATATSLYDGTKFTVTATWTSFTDNGTTLDGLQFRQNGAAYLNSASIEIIAFGGVPLSRNTGQANTNGTFASFAGKISAIDAPRILPNTSFYGAFMSSTVPSVNFGNIGAWTTTNVNDMSWMFAGATGFNQYVGNWDTSNVTTLLYTFQSATVFNNGATTNIGGKPLTWNTIKVTDFSVLFQSAPAFNQYIGDWDTRNAVTMNNMFLSATAFNNGVVGNLGGKPLNFNTAKAQNIANMFNNAAAFNQNVSSWNTGLVTNMDSVFIYAVLFNNGEITNTATAPLNWNTANVTNMTSMFESASVFNQYVGSWNTASVGTMLKTFRNAPIFNNGDLTNTLAKPMYWNTVNVGSMNNMFYGASSFCQHIGGWDTRSCGNNTDTIAISQTPAFMAKFNNGTNLPRTVKINGTIYTYSVLSSYNYSQTELIGYSKVDLSRNRFVFDITQATWTASAKTPIINTNGSFVGLSYATATSLYDATKFTVTATWTSFTDNGTTLDGLHFRQNGAAYLSDSSIEIIAFGGVPLSRNTGQAVTNGIFAGFSGKISAIDSPRILPNTSFYGAFYNCAIASVLFGNVGAWNTAFVTNMASAFQGATYFNQRINSWNTALVTNMASMFQGASAFNQNISSWNTALVTNMASAFQGASAFNQNIGSWNTALVTNMASAFQGASAFNQNIGSWNTTIVTNMNSMFLSASAFNQNITYNTIPGAWNTINVTDISGIFQNASTFNNGDASNTMSNPLNWNTRNVTTVAAMFKNATSFNQRIGALDTSKVTAENAIDMSLNATAFANASATNLPRTIKTDGTIYTYSVLAAAPNNYAIADLSAISIVDTSANTFVFDINQSVWTASAQTPIINTGSFVGLAYTTATSNYDATKYTVTATWTSFTDNGTTLDGLQCGSAYLQDSSVEIFRFGGVPLSRNTGQAVTNGIFAGFAGKISALDAPRILSNTSFYGAFYNCTIASVNFGNIGTWNTALVTNMASAFQGASAFNQNISLWNTALVTNIASAFQGASAFNQNIGSWNTALVTNMASMFQSASAFNQNIGSWNTTLVSNMASMFLSASAFNNGESTNLLANPLYWNTSNVTDMTTMFNNATVFNQRIGMWNTQKVSPANATDITLNATAFGTNSNLPVSIKTDGTIYTYSTLTTAPYNYTNQYMISSASALADLSANTFIFDLSKTLWDTSANLSPIINTNESFAGLSYAYTTSVYDATKYTVTATWTSFTDNGTTLDGLQFCQGGSTYLSNSTIEIFRFGGMPLSRNTGKLATNGIFASFAGKISAIDTPRILPNTTFYGAFYGSAIASINFGNVGTWNTANVIGMGAMFQNATNFNQNIGTWNTANIIDMGAMFQSATNFNQNIGSWNTANVTIMSSMFQSATNFNQNIGSWNTANVTTMSSMFQSATNFNNSDLTTTMANPMYWNTRKVTNMNSMFNAATKFNQHIGAWDTRNCTSATTMFTGATVFGNSGNLPLSVKTDGTIYPYSTLAGYATPYSQTELMGYSIVDLSANKFVFDLTKALWDASGNKSPIININGSFAGLTYNYATSLYDGTKYTVTATWTSFTDNGTTLDGLQFRQSGTPAYLSNASIEIIAFGGVPLSRNTGQALENGIFASFAGKISAIDAPRILPNTSFCGAFYASAIVTANFGNIGAWTTTNVNNMSFIFHNATAFNQYVGNWDTSNVTTLLYVFCGATAFNNGVTTNIGGKPLNWNTIKVIDFSVLFQSAPAFNQYIGAWDTRNALYMNNMFLGATKFNNGVTTNTGGSPLLFNTANVTNMATMFNGAAAFNQNISSFNTANVTNMTYMFNSATVFNNGDTGNNGANPLNWNTGNVTYMAYMFSGTGAFNQFIGNWNTVNVTSFANMFQNATAFNNGDPGNNGAKPMIWNTINALSLFGMFSGATSFNQNVGSWNTVNVASFQSTFASAIKFNNGDPNNTVSNPLYWNFKSSYYMNMFDGASKFNQHIGTWYSYRNPYVVSMFNLASTFGTGGNTRIIFNVDGSRPYTYAQLLADGYTTAELNSAAPTEITVIAADQKAIVSYTQYEGYGPVVKMQYTTDDGTNVYDCSGYSSPITIYGLQNNTVYSNVKIRGADISNNFGPWSAALPAFTPTVISTPANIGTSNTFIFKVLSSVWGGVLPIINTNNSFTNLVASTSDIDINSNVTVTITWNSFTDTTGTTLDGLQFTQTGNIYCTHPSVEILQFGGIPLSRNNATGIFEGFAGKISAAANDCPTILPNTSFSRLFWGSSIISANFGNISNWYTANVINLSSSFYVALGFNQYIGDWNTANVITMNGMFNMSTTGVNINGNPAAIPIINSRFNQPIGTWDTGNVTDMTSMFNGSGIWNVFNQPIGNWNMKFVQVFNSMFRSTAYFNQNIGNWNTASMRDIMYMFNGAATFNNGSIPFTSGNPLNWNTGRLRMMEQAFFSAQYFNQNIGNWNTTSVYGFGQTFLGATNFNNGDLPNASNNPMYWNTTSIENGAGWPSALAGPKFGQRTGAWDTRFLNRSGTKPTYAALQAAGYSTLELNGIAPDQLTVYPANTKAVVSFNHSYGGYYPIAKFQYTLDNNTWVDCSGTNATIAIIGLQNGTLYNTMRIRTVDTKNNYGATSAILPAFTPTVISTIANIGTSKKFVFKVLKSQWDLSGGKLPIINTAPISFSSLTTSVSAVDANLKVTVTISWSGDFIDNGTTKNGLQLRQSGTPTYLSNIEILEFGGVPLSRNTGEAYTNGIFAYFTGKISAASNDCPTILPNTSFLGAFSNCNIPSVNFGNISRWETSNVINMSYMFAFAYNFNEYIGDWNTSNVTNMSYMFQGANYVFYMFNQYIGAWDTSKVTDMSNMFNFACYFNQYIGDWNTANVINMSNMFSMQNQRPWNGMFNQSIGNWNTGKVTNMTSMFNCLYIFNHNIGNWNTGSVTNMTGMFSSVFNFNNGEIANTLSSPMYWNTANVTTMNSMFAFAYLFNQHIGAWNTTKVTDNTSMFTSTYFFGTLNNLPTTVFINNSNKYTAAQLIGWGYADSELNHLPTGFVQIIGNPIKGATLSLVNSIVDVDGFSTAFTYKWYANSVAIGGATNATYTLTANENNKIINCVVSYYDLKGAAESVTSNDVYSLSGWLDSSYNSNLLVTNYVSGFVDISGGDISARNGNTYVATDLTVTGNTILYSNVGIGVLTATYNLDVSGIVNDRNSILIDGDVSLNSRIFIGRDLSVNGILYAKYQPNSILSSAVKLPTINVFSDASMNNRLFVGADASLNRRLVVGADASLNRRLFVGADASLNRRLFVGADASMNRQLFVGADASLNRRLFVLADVSMNQRLFVGGDVSLNQRAFVGGDVSMNRRAFVGGDVSMNRGAFVGADASLNRRLFVGADASLNRRAFVGADVSMNQKLFIGADASMNQKLFVGGDAYMNKIFVNTDISLNRGLAIGADASLNNRLFVGGNAELNQRLFIGGDLSINGLFKIANTLQTSGNLYILPNSTKRTVTINNAVNISAITTYSGATVDLTNTLPISQNILLNTASPTLTMPTLTTQFTGISINIRKIDAAMNTDLSINAPLGGNTFIASGSSGDILSTLSVPKAISGITIVSDGNYWYQL